MAESERDLKELFLDNLTDHAMIVLDVDGKVLTWNAGARELLGYLPNEIIGRHFSDLYSMSDVTTSRLAASMQDALAWGRNHATDRLAHKDGTTFDAKIVLRPLSDAQR